MLIVHVCAPQVEDSSKLEYQAGQEEEEGAGKDKRKPEPQKQQQEQDAGAKADQDKQDGEGEEEGGVNEDVEDKNEESHFAPPTAPEQVGLMGVLVGVETGGTGKGGGGGGGGGGGLAA